MRGAGAPVAEYAPPVSPAVEPPAKTAASGGGFTLNLPDPGITIPWGIIGIIALIIVIMLFLR